MFFVYLVSFLGGRDILIMCMCMGMYARGGREECCWVMRKCEKKRLENEERKFVDGVYS